MKELYDVLVVGGGPAGCLTARLLPASLSVALVDRPKGKGGFHKPCGGLLSPDARRSLASLGLEVPEEIVVSPKPYEVRVLSVDTGEERTYGRSYVNVDRALLDAWFLSLVPDRVDRYEAVFLGYERKDGVFEVSVRDHGTVRTLRARALVGADGGGSAVRRRTYGRETMRRYTAVQEWYRESGEPSGYACVFDPETTDCCAWSISKNGLLVYGGAFPMKGCKKRFEKHRDTMTLHGYDLSAPLKREACVVFRPKRLSDVKLGKDGVFLVGEAAGLISPSSLEGISFAVDSAAALAASLPAPDPVKAYRKATAHLRRKIFARLCKEPFMYKPFLRFLVMKSGVTAVR